MVHTPAGHSHFRLHMSSGVELDCARECSVILFKGHAARRLPIEVQPIGNLTAFLPYLRVDDRYLVLDSLGRARSDDVGPHDLMVFGGSINVHLSGALIRTASVDVNYGTLSVDHLRHDYVKVWNVHDDVMLQDGRNYELQ